VSRLDRRVRFRGILGRAGFALLTASVLLLGLVSLGTTVGRFNAVAIEARGAGVNVAADSVVVVSRVPTLSLRPGDKVVTRLPGATHDGVYRVQAIDSWTRDVYARGIRRTTSSS
jgi:hypothetical protein